MISERTKIALEYKKNNNEIYGTIPYGWKCSNEKKLIKCEEEQCIIRIIKKIYNSKKSYNYIAEVLNYNGYNTRSGGRWYAQQVKNILNKGD